MGFMVVYTKFTIFSFVAVTSAKWFLNPSYSDSSCTSPYTWLAYGVGPSQCRSTGDGRYYYETCGEVANLITYTQVICTDAVCSQNCSSTVLLMEATGCYPVTDKTTFIHRACQRQQPAAPWSATVAYYYSSSCAGTPVLLYSASPVCRRDTVNGLYEQFTIGDSTISSKSQCTDATCSSCRTTEVFNMNGECIRDPSSADPVYYRVNYTSTAARRAIGYGATVVAVVVLSL
eukprot:TRINITY_DN32670_c0_g1_i1.p1 TRINITY_DN32670_c0_g1~~TRINITY_DN32670_c0_g1_i1.p1  ORF type:complete len:232 (-),score=14.45 TRINITY_DN32670_c0_g1_i1:35-730(-)